MPEIKLKHVVSCSTEDTVSQYETFNQPFIISFAHWVEWEPCVLSLLVMMSYRLTRRTTCWALTPIESGKQRDPVRSKHQSFCRYVSALLLPHMSACSAYVMHCFVVMDVILTWLVDQFSFKSNSHFLVRDQLSPFILQTHFKKAGYRMTCYDWANLTRNYFCQQI